MFLWRNKQNIYRDTPAYLELYFLFLVYSMIFIHRLSGQTKSLIRLLKKGCLFLGLLPTYVIRTFFHIVFHIVLFIYILRHCSYGILKAKSAEDK